MATCLNIVVVEDNDDLRDATLEALRAEGHSVVGIDCAESLSEQTAWSHIDVMILDVGLPGEDGLSLARRIRAVAPAIGLIMMTARGLPLDRKAGYDCGADIYLAKPVSLEELLAAIQALARRLGLTSAADIELRLDLPGLALHGALPSPVRLSPQEAALLAAFCRAPDKRLESWQLIEVLEKLNGTAAKASLEITITRLRKKIQQMGKPAPLIKSLRNWGYQLCVPIRFS